MFSWSPFTAKLIRRRASVHYRVTERVQQMRFLPYSRSPNTLLPVGQDLFHISLRTLQRFKVRFDALKLLLRKLVNPVAGSASGITSFQDLSQLCQSESDPKGPLHHKHSLHGAGGIDAVTGVRSRRSWENADPFIVSNRVWTQPSRLGQGPGTKSFRTAALHHKKYQPRNAFQSQGICLRFGFLAEDISELGGDHPNRNLGPFLRGETDCLQAALNFTTQPYSCKKL
jgi:hypothetical protein